MDLLSDMLQAVDPSDRAVLESVIQLYCGFGYDINWLTHCFPIMQAVKDEVIVDLVERCRSNQKKLMQMLTSTGLVISIQESLCTYICQNVNNIVDLRGSIVVLNSILFMWQG